MPRAQAKPIPAPASALELRPIHDLPPLKPLDIVVAEASELNDPNLEILQKVLLAVRQNDFVTAIGYMTDHLEKNPKNPAILNFIGALYLQQRDAQNANKHLTQAGRYANGFDLKIANNQACVYLLQESWKMAETVLMNARRQDPDTFAQYDYNLAYAAAFQKKIPEALAALTRSMNQEVFVESFVLKARISYTVGDLKMVEQDLLQGLQKFPNAAILHYYLAGLRMIQGDVHFALQVASKAFQLDPNNRHYAMLYASIIFNISFEGYNSAQIGLVTACLQNPSVNTNLFSQAWHSLFNFAPYWQDAVAKKEKFGVADGHTLIDTLKQDGELSDPFIIHALRRMIMKNERSERVFLALRHAYLERASGDGDPAFDDQDRIFIAALACQCFYNEYDYYETADESEKLAKLRARFDPGSPNIDDLLVLCTYGSILSWMTEAQTMALKDHPLCAQIVRDQVINRQTEFALMEKLPQLTPINDAVSKAVEQMYLENPYPSWISTQYRGNVDHLRLNPQKEQRGQILIAGCGTGHHAIMSALSYENTHVTAIDLSRRSLAYAKRKTDELGIPNIDYAQADILELGSMKKKFDIVESVGVLHHLADPLKGLRIVLDLLKPGGIIKLGLYSEIARVAMVAGRDEIARMGYTPTLDGIRQFRHDVLSNPTTHAARSLLKNGDFYTLSTCRDLVFHVQESRYTLPQIKEILANHNLEFLEFNLDIPNKTKFQKKYPAEKDLQNLDLWHQFEQEFPDTFSNMYQFSARKRANLDS